MAELPEHDDSPNGEKVRAISLDLVKRRLDRGLYKRLDHFQQDMFAVFERYVNCLRLFINSIYPKTFRSFPFFFSIMSINGSS